MTDQAYFTGQEAADYMRCSVETIKNAIRAGRLRAKKTGAGGGGHYRISRADLDAWFEEMADA